MKKKRIIRNSIKWSVSVFCFLGAVATISKPNLGSVLLLLLAAAELPIKPVDELWGKIIRHPVFRIVKRIAFLFVFIIAAGLIPTDSAGKEESGQEILLEESQSDEEEQIAEEAQDGDADQSNMETLQQGETAQQSEEALMTEREVSGHSKAEDSQNGEGSTQSKDTSQSQREITGQRKGNSQSQSDITDQSKIGSVLQGGDAGQNKGEIAQQAAAESEETNQNNEQPFPDEVSWQNRGAVSEQEKAALPVISLQDIPAYAGNPYTIINGNQPFFTDDELVTEPFETYSELDSLGRCGAAYANICIEIMPTEERGAIGMIKPSGWQTIKYDFVDGKYLYNRCHLIGFQLAGENANTKNLITGTRYLNTIGMLPFENQVASYVERTDNHVLYRVTPLYEGNNLVANGVLMEAKSVEDKGEGICFSVFCYNVQPGVAINYTDGTSREDGSLVFPESTKKPAVKTSAGAVDAPSATADTSTSQSSHESEKAPSSQPQVPSTEEPATKLPEETVQSQTAQPQAVSTEEASSQTPPEAAKATDTTVSQTPQEPSVSTGYVLNTNTHKFHRPDCGSVSSMKAKNRQDVNWTKAECEAAGYVGCKNCNP